MTMVDEGGIMTAVQTHPDACAGVYWGKRPAAVRVDLGVASPRLLGELLLDAWEGKAPAGLARPAAGNGD